MLNWCLHVLLNIKTVFLLSFYMFLIFSSSVAIILHVICCGFFALFSVGMRYAGQVIFVFVAKQTVNDDCAKVQLVTKENIFSLC